MMNTRIGILYLFSSLVLLFSASGMAMAARDSIQFEDVSDVAGLDYIGPSWGSMWGDFNGDGLPDIWVVNHYNAPSLYLNQGNGTFVDIVTDVIPDGIPEDFYGYDAHGATWADFDNDGDQDIYMVADGGDDALPALLMVNTGGQFEEVGVQYGVEYSLGRGRMPSWLDFDKDGLLDLLHPTSRRSNTNDLPTALFRQNDNGIAGFTEVSEEVGMVPNDIKTNDFHQISDLNGDGNLELLTQFSGYPAHIYNMTEFAFEDIQSELGLVKTAVVVDATLADFDGDLDIDLFMVRGEMPYGAEQIDDYSVEAHFSLTDNTERGFSFQTSGEITVGIWPHWVWFPNQIFIGSDGVNPPDHLFTLSPDNPEVWGVPEHIPGIDPGMYIGYDPDTQIWQILRSEKLTNIVVESTLPITNLSPVGWSQDDQPRMDRLMVNTGQGFVDQTTESGFLVSSAGRNVVAGDFDNDMDQDLYIVSSGPASNLPNILYQNDGNGNFTKLPDAGGAAGNNLGRGDAVTFADFNRDGFLDLLVTNGLSKAPFDQDGPVQLFKNLGNGNHWLEIDLIGVASNRDGLGASLKVTAGGVVQLREQGGGIHYRGQNHQRIHFGLGTNTMVDELEIRWPNGIIQTILDIPSDQILQVTEDVDMDFGDAPDPNYPTILANSGARHIIVPDFFLGASVDSELDGQPSANADGDNLNGVTNDEDGVDFSSVAIPGGDASVNVVASASGMLNAWYDFNIDGDWDDIGEQIFTDQILVEGVNELFFHVPEDAALGESFARFRFNSDGGLAYFGQAADGEVEDYRVEIVNDVTGITPGLSEAVFALFPNAPNPFNPSTNIKYSLDRASSVSLRILDVQGKLIRTLVLDSQPAGIYTVTWNGRNNSGQPVASGIYFSNLKTNFREVQQKMLLLK